MPVIRVDTFDGYLSSVLVKSPVTPFTLLGTITGGSIVNTGGGAYTVDVGALTGNWLLILRDSSNQTLGIKYAGESYLQAADYPQWLSGTPSYGPIKYTVTVRDSVTNNPIAGAGVRVYAGASVITAYTDMSGVASFYVSAGAWYAVITYAGYTTAQIGPTTVSVDTNSNVFLVALTLSTPSDPMLCVVDFYVWGDEGPLAGATVHARIDDVNAKTSTHLISQAKHKDTTDANGHAQLQLVKFAAFTQGGVYIVEIRDSRGNAISTRRVTVPNLSNANATQLVDVT